MDGGREGARCMGFSFAALDNTSLFHHPLTPPSFLPSLPSSLLPTGVGGEALQWRPDHGPAQVFHLSRRGMGQDQVPREGGKEGGWG